MSVSWSWPDATVIDILDGDTLTMHLSRGQTTVLDAGFGIITTTVTTTEAKVRLRLNRVNAPKGSTVDGQAAKAYLLGLLPVGTDAMDMITTAYKYGGPDTSPGEWMCEVTVPAGNVSDLMVTAGHAVYWNGQGPRPSDG